MNRLLQELNVEMGLSLEEISDAIAARLGTGADQLQQDQLQQIGQWLNGSKQIPDWANKAAALWVIELWMGERDVCHPGQLLAVDKKYTRLLRSYSMAEIVSFRCNLQG